MLWGEAQSEILAITMKERFKLISAGYLVLVKEEKVLLSRRYNTGFCDGMYGLPSGHVEEGESVMAALIREAREEVGIECKPSQVELAHLHSRQAKDGHRLDTFFVAKDLEGEPRNLEPEKCDDLSWFSWEALPDNTVLYVRQVLESIRKGERYSESGWEGGGGRG